MVLSVGEILVDMMGVIKNGKTTYERKAGGAPFNLACGVKAFGKKAGFVGSVGEDIHGEFLLNFAASKNFDYLQIKTDQKRNTTLAFVENDDNGERHFCFYRKNTADAFLPEIDDEVLKTADIIHIGSLMLSEKAGLKYAVKLLKKAKELGKEVSFDVNFRSDIFKNEKQAIDAYKKIIEYADIVKFSSEEAEIFGKDILTAFPEKLVLLTLGKDGSKWFFEGRSSSVPTADISPVDTTGAGDAFFAAVLSKLDGVSKSTWSDEFLNDALLFGNCAGALNTLGKGAIDFLPSLRQIEELKKTVKKN